MTTIRSRSPFLALSLLAALALGGCTAQAAPAPQPADPTVADPAPTESTPQTTPASPPSDDASAVSEVVVTATAIELHGEDGALLVSYDYFQPTEEVLVGLEGAFGGMPVSTPYPAGGDQGPGVRHAWGGFTLVDTDLEGQAPYTTNHWVTVSAASANGVKLSTVDGIAVGDDAAALEAEYPESSNRVTVTGSPERLDIYVGHSPLPDFENGANGTPLTFSVWLIAPDPSGVVEEFRAPSPNFGA